MGRNIYQATSIRRVDHNGDVRTVQLEALSYVFDCPDCEYVMTALTLEGAETIERRHMLSLPSTHLESYKIVAWDLFNSAAVPSDTQC